MRNGRNGWIVASLVALAGLCAGCASAPPASAAAGPDADYLGETLPGAEARLFAVGTVCTGMNDRDLAVSPDGNEIYFTVVEAPRYSIVRMHREDGRWLGPEVASFSGRHDDYEPQFSPDGRRLWFCSTRPPGEAGEAGNSDIWYVERTPGGWSEPVNPGAPLNTEKAEYYPSVTRDGTVYFTSHDMKLYRCRPDGDGFAERELLPETVNSGRAEYNAFVAPDESYLLFTSHGWPQVAGRGDLFVCFRDPDDVWSDAVCLGLEVNSDDAEMSPSVSPDGRCLFFSSKRRVIDAAAGAVASYADLVETSLRPGNGKMDVYWVDAAVIEACRPE